MSTNESSHDERSSENPFGRRFIRTEEVESMRVFDFNAWDDVEWPEEKELEIRRTIDFQKASTVEEQTARELVTAPDRQWEAFYETHTNKFFMDRKWLAKEFPELFETTCDRIPRVLDVGCGVGNTTIPLLEANPRLFVYSCDFSTRAIETLRKDQRADPKRCHPFTWDVTDSGGQSSIAPGSLDFVLCIFVLSAIRPDQLRVALENLVHLLRPNGMLMVKDYGRHDLTQLRFKANRLINDNFYRRGDDTLVYFFTPEELDELFQGLGLEKRQNFVDKRLVVNRAKQVKMYRRWVQCKYVKVAEEEEDQ